MVRKMEVKRYSENPNKYWSDIEKFRKQTFVEGNNSLSHEKYDPDIAVRVCRYHILDGYRFSHCGLIMGEHQIKWAREKGYKILYITHDINNITINKLYQRRKVMTVPSFKEHTKKDLMKMFDMQTLNNPVTDIIDSYYIAKVGNENSSSHNI